LDNKLVEMRNLLFARYLTSEDAELTDLEEKMMNIGLEQADKGLLTPHKEVRAKIDKWIAEKQA